MELTETRTSWGITNIHNWRGPIYVDLTPKGVPCYLQVTKSHLIDLLRRHREYGRMARVAVMIRYTKDYRNECYAVVIAVTTEESR